MVDTASAPRFDAQDRLLVGLRVAAIAAGVSYAFVSTSPGAPRAELLAGFFTCALYGGAFHAVAWRWPARKALAHRATAALDYAFVLVLVGLTGGALSPFYRALYLWVALLAFLAGRRGGLVGSIAAFGIFFGFHLRDRVGADPWVLTVQAAGILMHGPLVGFFVDRERRRAAELAELNRRLLDDHERLVHTEKLSSLGLLAAGVAHEINNPLSGVMSCVKVLREKPLDDARREEYFETVRDGLDRIRMTVQGLLDFARQRTPAAADVPLADVVGACARLLHPAARKKDVTVTIAVPGHVAVRADRSQLMQAVVNVLLNAIYAAPSGDEVVVSSIEEPGPDGLARVGTRIADRGPGIPRDVLPKVWDPFFTTKPEGEGTGLGLAVTQGIVRANGGDVGIESSEGRGTTVTLWFPKAHERREAVAHA